MSMTAPGRPAAAPAGRVERKRSTLRPASGVHGTPDVQAQPRPGTEPDRGTRFGFGPLPAPLPLVACGDRSPKGKQAP